MSANDYFKKMKQIVFDPARRLSFFSRLGLYNWMSDARYVKKEYFLKMGKTLNLDNPKTFNEKLQWLKLNDRKKEYSTMVDKIAVKEYISNVIGENYVIPTIGVYDKFDDIDFNELPNQFVLKCTHDSGGVVICKDKLKLNKKEARKKINKFLKRKYYYAHREWPYKNVKPRIIIEEYMKDKNSEELIDYKVMCFNGKAKIIFTCTERFGGGLKVTFFDLNWNKLPFKRHYPTSEKQISKPKCLKEMVNLSERLSKGVPFVRVDWYEINGKLFFGEYTFYPGAGLEEFTPDKWDSKLGDLIDLGAANSDE